MRNRRQLPPSVLILAFGIGCAALNEEEARLYRLGLQDLEESRWTEAIDNLSKVIEKKPSYEPALFHRGYCLFNTGDEDAAISDLEKAVASNDLSADELHEALFYLARSRIKKAEKETTQSELDSGGKRATASFAQALEELERALEIRRSYNALLWSGYCHMRLQGFDAALVAFDECAVLNSDRLEHSLFKAMTLVRASRSEVLPDKPRQIYLELLERDKSRTFHSLYEHVGRVFERFPPEDQSVVLSHLEHYLESSPRGHDGLRRFVATVRERREQKRIQDRLEELRRTTNRLKKEERFEEAVAFVKENSSDLPKDMAEVKALLGDLKEQWSRHLEIQADENLISNARQKLEDALTYLETARDLTTVPLRKAVLQHKVDTFRVALHGIPKDSRLIKIQETLWNSDYQEALENISKISPDELQEQEREFYHYLLGFTHYHLKNWKEAAEAFDAVPPEKFLNVELYSGVALWSSGRREEGFEKLNAIPSDTRPQEVFRILGSHAHSKGDYAAAVKNLEQLQRPRQEDLNALQRALIAKGVAAGKQGEWTKAVEDFRRAKEIIESKLKREGPEVYLQLGKAYWHLQEYDRAEMAFENLFSTEFSEKDRRRYRDAYLYKALLTYRKNDFESAFRGFEEFSKAGGKIPSDWVEKYRTMLAVYGDFVPVAEVTSWEYINTLNNFRQTIEVVGATDGRFKIKKTEVGQRTDETWRVQGHLWSRTTSEGTETVPIRVPTLEAEFPSTEYETRGVRSRSEIVSIGETAELADGKKYENCLKIETLSKVPLSEYTVRERKVVQYLAPNIGEVKRQVFEEGKKTAEWVLDVVRFRH